MEGRVADVSGEIVTVKSQRLPWFLYILECRDGTYYTGITNDIDRRLKAHNSGKASRYTRTRRPVTLLYYEKYADRSSALVRECKVKSWTRQKKGRLMM